MPIRLYNICITEKELELARSQAISDFAGSKLSPIEAAASALLSLLQEKGLLKLDQANYFANGTAKEVGPHK